MTPEDRQVFYYEGTRYMQPFAICLQALMQCGPDPKLTAFWMGCMRQAAPFIKLGEKMILTAQGEDWASPQEEEKEQPPQKEEEKTIPAGQVALSQEAQEKKDALMEQFGLDFSSVVPPA